MSLTVVREAAASRAETPLGGVGAGVAVAAARLPSSPVVGGLPVAFHGPGERLRAEAVGAPLTMLPRRVCLRLALHMDTVSVRVGVDF